MDTKDQQIVKSILGEDIFDILAKYEIYKPETKTVLDPAEVKIALEIVPRSILSYLFSELKWREPGEIADLILPFAPGKLHVEKKGADNYHGEIVKDGKIISRFQHRSLPSIGLMLLTAFELYDLDLLDEIKENHREPISSEESPDIGDDKINKLQDIIDDRLKMHKLVQDVVDKRISEHDAIGKMIQERLNSHVESQTECCGGPEEEYDYDEPKEQEEVEIMEKTKKSKLREFFESREKRRQESVDIDKSEISCPDCGTSLYKGEGKQLRPSYKVGDKFHTKQHGEVKVTGKYKHPRGHDMYKLKSKNGMEIHMPHRDVHKLIKKSENTIKLCVCFGEHMNKELKFKKNENGKVKIKFPKSFDLEDVEMLLSAIKGEGI